MAKSTTKKPDGTKGMKLQYQEVNWGNSHELMLTMVGNINQNLLDIKRDVEEIKKCCKTTKRKT